MSGEEELIITTDQLPSTSIQPIIAPSLVTIPPLPILPPLPYITTTLPVPKVPSLPSLSTLPLATTQAYGIEKQKTSATSFLENEDHVLVIHSICDILLFYMLFRYISTMYSHTKRTITDCRTSLHKLREEYGLQSE